jgi:RNA polymerase sigma-70 factor (ECF subfamily)
MQLSDAELMRRLARGDRDALAPLMERHYRRVYRIALAYLRSPEDALDAAQETFVKAFVHAKRWDAGTEVLPWLTRIATNQAIDQYRRARRRTTRFEPLEEGDHDERISAEGPSPERRVLGGEVGQRIRHAVDGLPEPQRAVFVLRHYEEMSLEEIGRSLGLRLGTVKSSLHRAVRRLRDRLAEVHA